MSNPRLLAVLDNMEKRAFVGKALTGASKALKGATPETLAGGGLGAAYGAYQGATNAQEGQGLTGAVLGGLSGAAGGAILGGVGGSTVRAVAGKKGQKGLIGRFRDTKKQFTEEARKNLGKDAPTGMFSSFRARKAYATKGGDKSIKSKLKNEATRLDDLADAGQITAKQARNRIDAAYQATTPGKYYQARNELIGRTAGLGVAGFTAVPLITGAGGSAAAPDAQQVSQGLYQKYQQTGSLDEREMMLLNESMRKLRSQQATAQSGGSTAV